MKQVKLLQGDNILSLKKLPENSIDSIVTDPPYGLSFMGKKWDYDVPSVEFWKEVYRVLKPGGHVLSFGGTRTYHRMVLNMEDAGFEIRDQIMWIYGSGFPKSLNIGKAFDKKNGNEREVTGERLCLDMNGGKYNGTENGINDKQYNYTKGSSQYEGWGTALKPANEPICLARKPLSEKTIVDNVIKWGTGGINVDGCRIGTELVKTSANNGLGNNGIYCDTYKGCEDSEEREGRFPANILFDEEAAQVLDEQTGVLKGDSPNRGPRKGGGTPNFIDQENKRLGIIKENNTLTPNKFSGDGGASRFFYVAKVSKKERNLGLDGFEDKVSQLNSGGIGRKISVEKRLEENGENAPTMKNNHPTLKPINLMNYLCRLITPPGGIVLDPFMGSGSTGISACLEGFRFVGMELDEDYFKIAEARVNNFEEYRKLLK